MERLDHEKWIVADTPPGPAEQLPKPVIPFIRSVAAAVGIFSGIAALFIGLVCVAVHVVIRDDAMFDRVGSILLICAIPLMLAGSAFLDDPAPKR